MDKRELQGTGNVIFGRGLKREVAGKYRKFLKAGKFSWNIYFRVLDAIWELKLKTKRLTVTVLYICFRINIVELPRISVNVTRVPILGYKGVANREVIGDRKASTRR